MFPITLPAWGADFIRQNVRQILMSKNIPLTELIKNIIIAIFNIGIQMKQKELTKTFMMVSNRKKPMVIKRIPLTQLIKNIIIAIDLYLK